MQIKELSLKSKRDRSIFIDFAWEIYKKDKTWVPPLKIALHDLLSPKHPVHETSDIKIWIVVDDSEKCIGRIAAINNHHYNAFHKNSDGFFGFFECIDDHQVAKILLDTACSYLKDSGLKNILGPVNPTTNYECGLLVKGFDDPPQIMMTYNPKYYIDLLEHFGFTKIKDLWAHKIISGFEMPKVLTRISQRLEKSNRISYRAIDMSKFSKEIELMLDIYNDAWEKNWGFIPMTEKEFFHTAKDLKTVIDPKLVIFVEVNDEPAGFVIALPDYNQVFKNIPNGKLLPFGIFKILFGKKHINRLRVITLGIKHKFRHLSLASLLYKQAYIGCKAGNYEEVEMSWILEDNRSMNRPLTMMGSEVYKTYRIFQKDL